MRAHEIESLLSRRGTAPQSGGASALSGRVPRMRVLAALLGGCLLAGAPAFAAGGDDQAAATCITAFPYNDAAGTTVGAVDNYDLPPDTTTPTLSATCASSVMGGGPAGSLPNGASYTGTGTGPDVVYRMDFPAGNADTLTISMTPTGGQDLSLVVYCNTVSSALADGLVTDDTGVANQTESVTVGGIAAGTSLYVVVDGYSAGATPPGPSGPYTLSVTSNGAVQPGPCGAPSADLSITKTDGVTSAVPGSTTTYTITASNAGPSDIADGNVVDNFPAQCSNVDYTAVGAGGATGFTAAGTGNINDTALALPAGGSVTYTAICDIDPSATGSLDNTATVASATADPAAGNNSATDNDTLDVTADVAITKDDGVTTLAPGQSTTYTIVASNAGPSDVLGATVADAFPAECDTVSYSAVAAGGAAGFTAAGAGDIADTVDLPAGSSVTYTAICAVGAGASGELDNTATIATAAIDPDTGNNQANDTTTLVASADLAITKDDGVASVTPGGATTYSIVASNAGPSDVSGVSVADSFPAACTSVAYTAIAAGGATGFTAAGAGDIADTVNLPAGSSVTYTATCDVDAGATGTLDNTATIASVTDDPDTANNSATDSDTLGASADLSITKDDGVAGVLPGESTTYTIVASNAGPSDVSGVSVADSFPAACTSVAYTAIAAGGATGFTAAGAGDIADTVDLPVGSSVTYTATCDVDAGATGTLDNTATIASATDDPDTANNSATDSDTLGASADLSITKDDGVDSVAPGESTTYTIVVSNAGPSDASPVAVSDTFPTECESVAYTAVGAGGATGFTAAGAGNIADAALSLPAGSSVTYSATCNVDADAADASVITNTASVAGPTDLDPAAGNNSASDSTTVEAVATAAIGATKAVSGTFEPGDTVTYSIVLTNTGSGNQPDNAGDEFVDVLPAALTLLSASATGGTAVADIGTNTVRWNGSIAPAASVTITIDASIDDDANGSVANQGTVSFDSDADGSNDTSAVTDDPSTGDGGDPTAFDVAGGGTTPPPQAAPAVIPTLGQWGGGVLLMLLGALGLGALWRRNQG